MIWRQQSSLDLKKLASDRLAFACVGFAIVRKTVEQFCFRYGIFRVALEDRGCEHGEGVLGHARMVSDRQFAFKGLPRLPSVTFDSKRTTLITNRGGKHLRLGWTHLDIAIMVVLLLQGGRLSRPPPPFVPGGTFDV